MRRALAAALLLAPALAAQEPAPDIANARQVVGPPDSAARALLAAGYDEEQVLRYFERSYGEFVRLQPPLRGVNWIVWLAPLAGLLAGAWVVARALRSRGAPPAESGGAAGADDPELLPYLLRVREAAYGWPGGVPPVKSD